MPLFHHRCLMTVTGIILRIRQCRPAVKGSDQPFAGICPSRWARPDAWPAGCGARTDRFRDASNERRRKTRSVLSDEDLSITTHGAGFRLIFLRRCYRLMRPGGGRRCGDPHCGFRRAIIIMNMACCHSTMPVTLGFNYRNIGLFDKHLKIQHSSLLCAELA